MRLNHKDKLTKLGFFILVCEGAGFFGALIVSSSVSTWYAQLSKPFLTPAAWLFFPIWITLYFLMALSLFRAWLKKAKLKWFFIQLSLNILWSYLFFGLHELGLALIEIMVLLGAIIATMLQFNKKDALAAKLLWPYIVWVAFATLLNFSLWLKN